MRNYIILNGKNSNTIQGLLVQSLAPITKPMIRTQVEEIDGRDGDIVTPLGYSSYDKTITIGLYGNYDVNEVIEYFNSNGIVTFSNEPDKYYRYQINAQIDFERLIRFKTATVTMHCQPFKYSTTEQPEILTPIDELLSIPDWQQISNGVTVSCINGVISVSGTATTATEFYLPITALSLEASPYTLAATANGQNPNNCSIRMIGSTPSDADSFGNRYITLVQGTTSLSATLSASKTFNYIWFYLSAGATVGFTLTVSVTKAFNTVSNEGTDIVLDNTAETKLNRIDLKGNTAQDTYSGKNLFNSYGLTHVSIYGDLAIEKDGTIVLSNNTYSNGYYRFSHNTLAELAPSLVAGQTYYIYVDNNFRDGADKRMYLFGSATNWRNGEAHTITSDDLSGDIALYGGYQETTPIRVMITTASDDNYERFVGGAASPNPSFPQSVQTVSGENVIRIAGGKNLFDKSEAKQNYRLDALGQLYWASDYFTSGFIPVSPNTDYSINVSEITTASAVATYDADKNFISRIYGANFNRKTTESNAAFIRFCTEKTHLDSVMLEKGSDSTYFEPYNIREYVVDLCTGKNMLDASKLNGQSVAGLSCSASLDGIITITGTSTASGHFSFPERFSQALLGKTLTFSFAGTFSNLTNIGLKNKTSNEIAGLGHIGGQHTTKTFVVTQEMIDSVAKVDIYFESGQTVNASFTIQLEVSADVTAHERYMQLELCKIDDYQDYIYKSENKWYKHKTIGKVDLSTLTWTATTGAIRGTTGVPNIKYVSSNQQVGSAFAEKYKLRQGSGLGNNLNYFAIDTAKVNVNTGSGGINPTGLMYYALATPEDEEITNSVLIDELEALSQAYSYRQRTRINSTFLDGNAPHILAVEALANAEGIITNSGNIYSKPKLTIFGSGDIAVYLNNVQMFQIALGDNQYITIDTATLEAYKDTTENLMNRLVTGDYQNFAFQVGDNTLTFSGTVTECVVENYSRWL